jgi:hypothetical protein
VSLTKRILFPRNGTRHIGAAGIQNNMPKTIHPGLTSSKSRAAYARAWRLRTGRTKRPHQFPSLKQRAAAAGVNYDTFCGRLRAGMTLEQALVARPKMGRPVKYPDAPKVGYLAWWRKNTDAGRKRAAMKPAKTTRKRAITPVNAFCDDEPTVFASVTLAALEARLAEIDKNLKKI